MCINFCSIKTYLRFKHLLDLYYFMYNNFCYLLSSWITEVSCCNRQQLSDQNWIFCVVYHGVINRNLARNNYLWFEHLLDLCYLIYNKFCYLLSSRITEVSCLQHATVVWLKLNLLFSLPWSHKQKSCPQVYRPHRESNAHSWISTNIPTKYEQYF